MAFLLPTIATKRTNRSVARNLAGASAIFIARTRSTSLARDYSAAGGRIPTSWARRRGALEAVIDGLAQARAWYRHHRDSRGTRRIEHSQVGKQIGRGLDEIAAPRPAPAAGVGPKASSASCASTRRASSRSRARGA